MSQTTAPVASRVAATEPSEGPTRQEADVYSVVGVIALVLVTGAISTTGRRVLGVPVGALAVIGIGLVQDGEAAWVPWPQLALLVVGVPLLAAAITWLVVPGRLPVRQADRD